ncbi:MAG TPA: EAL domain-containing protein [Xanthobacteraceae bacterium]|nr:EAL domain-containing protein [Xanthobacteraceae bacterium]HYQ09523.1 EAL domain-containing protein [Xanthobacteraceae bacterium]
MSSEAQQVSAAFTSGVNPKIADCCCLSLVAQHDRSGPCFSRSAGGEARGNLATDDNVNPRGPAVDLAEALRAGWFELWYQPKIGSQAQDLQGAEALIRMRHPRLGIIQPADFMLDVGDRRSLALSQFVIAQALADWRYFFTEQRPLDISINLPISFIAVAGIL